MQNTQDMIQRLNLSGSRLSKSHRRIAEYILQHYDKAVFMTAAKLGEMVNVSESTVVRFAVALGYEGYPELQQALQELERAGLVIRRRKAVGAVARTYPLVPLEPDRDAENPLGI